MHRWREVPEPRLCCRYGSATGCRQGSCEKGNGNVGTIGRLASSEVSAQTRSIPGVALIVAGHPVTEQAIPSSCAGPNRWRFANQERFTIFDFQVSKNGEAHAHMHTVAPKHRWSMLADYSSRTALNSLRAPSKSSSANRRFADVPGFVLCHPTPRIQFGDKSSPGRSLRNLILRPRRRRLLLEIAAQPVRVAAVRHAAQTSTRWCRAADRWRSRCPDLPPATPPAATRRDGDAAALALVPFQNGQFRAGDCAIPAGVALLRPVDDRIHNHPAARVHEGDRPSARSERAAEPLVRRNRALTTARRALRSPPGHLADERSPTGCQA